jgi:eukaryotic-like serine/threonine-protein kinase
LLNTTIGGRFQLRRRLGDGAHARVYAAYDHVRHGEVALKLYNEHALDAISAEAATHFRVADCAAVLPLYDVLPDLAEAPATSMPIAAGTIGDFDDVFASQALDWTQRVLTALEFCHGRGVVHGDVKPRNVFLDEHQAVRLGDFGVADFMPDASRGHTLEYAAPELLAGEARNPSTDVWASAVLLYELLCAEMPFGTRGELADAEVAARITAGAHPDPLARRPYLPRRFRTLFRDSFVPNPAERPLRTAGGLKQALADIPVRCEWVRLAVQGHVETWEGHEVSAAGVRTGVVYVAWIERRPRLGVAEGKLTRQQGNRRAQALPGLGVFSGSEAQARQRIYTWMRNLTSGGDPRH